MGQSRLDLGFGVLDVLLQELKGDNRVIVFGDFALMHIQDMGCDHLVGFRIIDVSHDEDAVETRKNGAFQLDLLIYHF